jgi:hypothetical protein
VHLDYSLPLYSWFLSASSSICMLISQDDLYSLRLCENCNRIISEDGDITRD